MGRRSSVTHRWWVGGVAIALGLAMLAPPAQAAVDGEYLDVGFGGAFSSGHDYTNPTGEVMAGQLSRMAGTERLNDESFERFVTLDGGDSGITFTANDFAGAAVELETPFIAEVAFTPDGAQPDLTTVFAAGGNLFVRYQNGELRYGFSSNAGGSWTDYVETSDELPVTGEENVLQLSYAPQESGGHLTVWLNGAPLPPVEATNGDLPGNGEGLGSSFGFGNDVTPGGSERGMSGTLSRVRLAAPEAGFEVGEDPAVDSAVLHTRFAGTVVEDAYEPVADDIVAGILQLRPGTPFTSGEGVAPAAPDHGLDFTADDLELGDGQTVDTPFIAEMAFTPEASQRAMGTLLGSGGNLFVRYQNDQLRYGYSSNVSGAWEDYVQTVPAPSAGEEHVLSVAYLPGADQTRMVVYLDGEALPVVEAAHQANDSGAIERTISFGNDVHPQGLDRGFQGAVSEVRLAPTTLGFSVSELALQGGVAEPLVNVSFQGDLSDGAYQPATGELVTGMLRAEGVTLDVGVSTGSGEGSGWTWPLPSTSLLADGLLTEVSASTELIATAGRLIDVAGAVELSVTADGQVKLSAGEESVVVELGEPLTYFAAEYYELGLLIDSDGTAQLHVNGQAAGDPVQLVEPTTTDVAFLTGTTGPAYGLAATATTDGTASTLPAQPCLPGAIDPATTIEVSAGECATVVEAKASALRPSPAQDDFHRAELTAFLHYGPNTYYDQEWGHGTEDPARFDPSDLDTDQWARTLADNGFRYAILTVKHHDGFMLYPSRYTDHTVAASPWRDGEGDLLREFVDSARSHGLRVGVYLSPADSHQELEGVYGNGSERTERTIPTLVEGDDRTEAVTSGDLPTFTYQATDYGAHFLNTLYEILTEYGTIDEMWFDGAGGNTEQTEIFDYDAYFDLIDRLQPDALIAIAGNDVRWVGNEHGLAREAEWNPQAVHLERGRMGVVPGAQNPNLGSLPLITQAIASGQATHLHWYPAEADVSIRPGWFWHQDQQPKSVDQLMDIHQQSIGRNAVLLLNVPPTTAGLLDERDVTRLAEWTEEVRRQRPDDLALGQAGTVDHGEGPRETKLLTDGRTSTGEPAVVETPQYTVSFDEPVLIDRVELAEDIVESGQQVEGFVVETRAEGGSWTEVASGPVIGYKRIVSLSEAVPVEELRVRVTDARGPVSVSMIAAYRGADQAPELPTEYYLDTGAATAGLGTAEAPFSSLEQMRSRTFPVGSTIHVRRGTEVTGDFTLWGYGTDEDPVTLASYGEGPDPVYDVEGVAGTTAAAVIDELGYDVQGWVAAQQDPAPTDPLEGIAQLSQSLEGYVDSGDVAGPIAGQLGKAVELAERHLAGERSTPALRALERFVRHLENPKRPDTLTDQARAELRGQAEVIIDLVD